MEDVGFDGRGKMEEGRQMMEDVIILHLNSHLTFYSDERVVLRVLRNRIGLRCIDYHRGNCCDEVSLSSRGILWPPSVL